jgi:hypothetical protein
VNTTTEPYPDIAARFRKETATHQMTVLHDDGLYRHLRFLPAEGPSSYWFDLITWPHNLAFRGDGETYAFSRVGDMFAFFRDGSSYGINPDYWSEKLTSDRDNVERYQEELFLRRLQREVDDLIEQEHVKPEHADRFRAEINARIVEGGDYWTIDSALRTVEDFEFYSDPKKEFDHRYQADIRFVDACEWVCGCKDFDWWFLWACHAIVWGIAQYDALGARP